MTDISEVLNDQDDAREAFVKLAEAKAAAPDAEADPIEDGDEDVAV